MKLIETKVMETEYTLKLTTKELATLVAAFGGSSDYKRREDAEYIGIVHGLYGNESSEFYTKLADILRK